MLFDFRLVTSHFKAFNKDNSKMSTSDLLSTSLNWPGKGLYGIKSSGK